MKLPDAVADVAVPDDAVVEELVVPVAVDEVTEVACCCWACCIGIVGKGNGGKPGGGGKGMPPNKLANGLATKEEKHSHYCHCEVQKKYIYKIQALNQSIMC